MSTSFLKKTLVPVDAPTLFAWHARPGAFERLAPTWQRIEVVSREGTIRDGDRTVLKMFQGPIGLRWVAEHRGYVEGERFEDVQVAGPFARWHHRHRFEPESAHSSWLIDDIEYALPLGPLGRIFGERKVRGDLESTFRFRHDVTRGDLELHSRFADREPLRVAITGASGLVGTTLAAMLTTGGHEVVRLVRRSPRADDEAEWDAGLGLADPERLAGFDAVVHLAGENIGAGRWTARRKEAIRSSRVDGTRALVASLARCSKPPATFLAASAVGYYGDTGATVVDEQAPSGSGFLAEVCRDWEAASQEAESFADRVVLARFGVVLSPRGGALQKMLPPFLAGAGGPVGGGEQQMSWISIDDAAGAIVHLLHRRSMRGAFNLTAPSPATNRVFTRALGRVLRRPTIAPLPAFAVRTLFGEMGEETLLASTGVRPGRLTTGGYSFRWPTLEGALRHLLGRSERNVT